ncbi:MAG: uracil-DNA glycosylase [Burkholderiaceae bacterium]|jgi:DNA polymerase|nr:uracil-DNA glycosylase [Burkholderiaceae bacterium]
MMRLLDARQRAMLAEMGVPLWMPPPAAKRGAAPAPEQTPAAAPPPATAAAAPVIAPPVAPIMVPPPAAALDKPASNNRARPADVEHMDWAQLRSAVAACRACGLCAGRTQTVFGVGSPRADWMVVGEAPGENEDRQGEPFVGQAGKLLDRMLAAIGRSRQAQCALDAASQQQPPQPQDGAGKAPTAPAPPQGGVYIANVLKCRPPGNRNPQPDEIAQCEPFLRRQIALLQPRIILAMGRFAVQSLLQTQEPIGRLRGRVHHWHGVPVVVTYHPAYLLRALPEKAKAWQDLCLALDVAESGGDGHQPTDAAAAAAAAARKP